MKEPNYKYVKGEGWVPDYTVWLKGSEIRIGDVLDMYRMPGGEETPFWNKDGTVKDIQENSDREFYSGWNFTLHRRSSDERIEWRVIKRG